MPLVNTASFASGPFPVDGSLEFDGDMNQEIEEYRAEQARKFYVVKGGPQTTLAGGMLRSKTDTKTDYSLVFDGPLVERLAVHLTKGLAHYPRRNWMRCAEGTPAEQQEALARFRESACRHFVQWLRGETDEDHFAAAVFNMNGYEYLLHEDL